MGEMAPNLGFFWGGGVRNGGNGTKFEGFFLGGGSINGGNGLKFGVLGG